MHQSFTMVGFRCLPVTGTYACAAFRSRCCFPTTSIQETQVIAPPKRQVSTEAPLRGPLNMQSAEHELHTLAGKVGDVASAAIPGQRFCDSCAVVHRAAHGRQTGYTCIGERSLIGELALHRVRVGRCRRTTGRLVPGRRSRQHHRRDNREMSLWRGRAVRVAQARSSADRRAAHEASRGQS
jgi:hypothetical protein